MKRSHLMITFSLVLVMLVMGAIVNRMGYKKAADEKRQIDYALQMAVDSAAEQLSDAYPNINLSSYLKSSSDAFFRTLVAGLNLYEDIDRQEELIFFVPALLVTCTDGFYINYLQKSGGAYERIWTECQPYFFSDEFFIYRFFLDDCVIVYEKNTGVRTESSLEEIMNDAALRADFSVGSVFVSESTYYEYKRAAVAESIASCLERVVNEHSMVAGQFGFSIVYGIPEFLSNYTPAQEYPSFIAVFQGYPLLADSRIIYNGSSTSAAYIATVERYVVEFSTGPVQPFSVFHKSGCSATGTYGMVLPDKYTQEEAVSIYGAYGCPHCFNEKDGVAVLP